MQMRNKTNSGLNNNRYADAEVEVVYGKDFEKVYNDFLSRRVAMTMRHVDEYTKSGGDVKLLLERL